MGKRTRTAVVAVAAASLLTSACANIGQEPTPEAPPGMIAELRLPADSANSVQGLENYNWLAPAPTVRDWIYEPLMIRDRLTCEAVPWLATAYDWPTPDHLVLTLREGVTWSDGEPFTADDVVYTFTAAQEFPGADRAGIWGETFGGAATAVTATDEHTVDITFAAPAVAKTDAILQDMRILPEHVYAGVGDPTAYIDTEGIGTGPFVPGDYNGRRLVMDRNESYWNAENVKVERLVLEGQYDANSGALKMRSGGLDIYRGDIPNPPRSVVAADPENNHFFYPPDGTTVLAINTERPVLDDPAFREGIAHAIDREGLALRASFGIMEPASQTMLLLPYQEDEVPERYQGEEYVGYEPDVAEDLLDAAGYPRNSDGLRTGPDGQPLSFTFSVQAGFVDYIAMGDVITRNLNAIGVQTRLVATDPNAVDGMQKSGDFDMVIDFVGGGCQRVRDLGSRLDTQQISSGEDLLLNRARYVNPEIDALVDEWASTSDEARAAEIQDRVIDVYMTEFPYIALQYAPNRLIYSTRHAVGWPSLENPYPVDQMLRVITQLEPPPDGDAAPAAGEED